MSTEKFLESLSLIGNEKLEQIMSVVLKAELPQEGVSLGEQVSFSQFKNLIKKFVIKEKPNTEVFTSVALAIAYVKDFEDREQLELDLKTFFIAKSVNGSLIIVDKLGILN